MAVFASATHVSNELILPFPAPLARLEKVSEVRSTLIASSLQALKTRGLLERYITLLPEPFRDTLFHCIAGQWFPLEVGFAHYRACDSLGLSLEEQKEIGSEVSRRIHETFLGVMVQMAKGVGVTPWTVLAKGNQVFGRVVRAAGCKSASLAPKTRRLRSPAYPCWRFRISGRRPKAFTRWRLACSPNARTFASSPANRACPAS